MGYHRKKLGASASNGMCGNSGPLMMALEPRILLDAAAMTTAADTINNTADKTVVQADPTVDTAAAQASTSIDGVVDALALIDAPVSTTTEVVFVDSAVADYQTLINGLAPGTEVVVLSANGDGVQQMADYLNGRTNIDSIQIFSHGDVGQVSLGNTTVDSTNVDTYQAAFATIGAALTETGDILFYGCRVAADGSGLAFIDSLAQLTSADVAASDDLTGAAALGGDWVLEQSTGTIEATNAVGAAALDSYGFTLAAPVAGFGSALTFDGTNDYVTGADADNNLDETTDFTIEAWIKPDDVTGDERIVHKNLAYDFGQQDAGLRFAVSGADYLTTSVTLSASTWQHVAVVVSDTTGGAHQDANFYVDGTFVETVTGTINPILSNNSNITIGAWTNAAGAAQNFLFAGQIDEVRIWSDVRTAAEISANMYIPMQGDEAGLVGLWNFDEGSGTTATDRSTSVNSGTLTNMVPTYVTTAINKAVTADQTSSVITMGGFDTDNDGSTQTDTVTPKIATLPTLGTLYQTSDGTTSNGSAISAGGTVSNADGKVIYVPNDTGQSGTDTFTYQTTDGTNTSSNTETVTITTTGTLTFTGNNTSSSTVITTTTESTTYGSTLGDTSLFSDNSGLFGDSTSSASGGGARLLGGSGNDTLGSSSVGGGGLFGDTELASRSSADGGRAASADAPGESESSASGITGVVGNQGRGVGNGNAGGFFGDGLSITGEKGGNKTRGDAKGGEAGKVDVGDAGNVGGADGFGDMGGPGGEGEIQVARLDVGRGDRGKDGESNKGNKDKKDHKGDRGDRGDKVKDRKDNKDHKGDRGDKGDKGKDGGKDDGRNKGKDGGDSGKGDKADDRTQVADAGGENTTGQADGAGNSDTNENTISGTLGNQGNDKNVGNAGGGDVNVASPSNVDVGSAGDLGGESGFGDMGGPGSEAGGGETQVADISSEANGDSTNSVTAPEQSTPQLTAPADAPTPTQAGPKVAAQPLAPVSRTSIAQAAPQTTAQATTSTAQAVAQTVAPVSEATAPQAAPPTAETGGEIAGEQTTAQTAPSSPQPGDTTATQTTPSSPKVGNTTAVQTTPSSTQADSATTTGQTATQTSPIQGGDTFGGNVGSVNVASAGNVDVGSVGDMGGESGFGDMGGPGSEAGGGESSTQAAPQVAQASNVTAPAQAAKTGNVTISTLTAPQTAAPIAETSTTQAAQATAPQATAQATASTAQTAVPTTQAAQSGDASTAQSGDTSTATQQTAALTGEASTTQAAPQVAETAGIPKGQAAPDATGEPGKDGLPRGSRGPGPVGQGGADTSAEGGASAGSEATAVEGAGEGGSTSAAESAAKSFGNDEGRSASRASVLNLPVTEQGNTMTFTVPPDIFIGNGDTAGKGLSLNAGIVEYKAALNDGAPLPGWLSFSANTGTFSGEAPKGQVQTLKIDVTAVDRQGKETTINLELSFGRDGTKALIRQDGGTGSDQGARLEGGSDIMAQRMEPASPGHPGLSAQMAQSGAKGFQAERMAFLDVLEKWSKAA